MNNELREKVVKEAAKLLYYRMVKSYVKAKETACSNLSAKAFPSNFEVAIELDRFADEVENNRRNLLRNMREDALQIMDKCGMFRTKLIGSVWRGTVRKGSDIDITFYSDDQQRVQDLIKYSYSNVRTGYQSRTSNGITKKYFHIYFDSPTGYEVEVVVRNPETVYEKRKCEIYGDYITGLTKNQLRKVLQMDAYKRFLPEKKK